MFEWRRQAPRAPDQLVDRESKLGMDCNAHAKPLLVGLSSDKAVVLAKTKYCVCGLKGALRACFTHEPPFITIEHEFLCVSTLHAEIEIGKGSNGHSHAASSSARIFSSGTACEPFFIPSCAQTCMPGPQIVAYASLKIYKFYCRYR